MATILFLLLPLFIAVSAILFIFGFSYTDQKKLWSRFFSFLFASLKSLIQFIFALFKLPFVSSAKQQQNHKESATSFATWLEAKKILNSSNKGLLIDGKSKRLSLEESYKGCISVIKTGGGKSSKIILPNIFSQLDLKNASIFVLDLSGELFSKTYSYAKKQGYKIERINLTDISKSLYFNPLDKKYITKDSDIKDIVDILFQGYSNSGDSSYWNNSSKILLTVIINIVIKNKELPTNLISVMNLVESFLSEPEYIDQLVSQINDDKIFSKYKSILSKPEKELSSIVSNTQSVFSDLEDNELQKFLSRDTLGLHNMRSKNTIFYFTVPEVGFEKHTTIISLFMNQFFKILMNPNTAKPIFLFLDEFGNFFVPNMAEIITQIRKKYVSILAVLQAKSQLQKQYGNDANTIYNGGVANKIIIKPSVEIAKETNEEIDGLLSMGEIKNIKDNQAIFLNEKQPIFIDPIYSYFENRKWK
jgi:type IV secretory pathway TraG/TraD family ATPase VirD4